MARAERPPQSLFEETSRQLEAARELDRKRLKEIQTLQQVIRSKNQQIKLNKQQIVDLQQRCTVLTRENTKLNSKLNEYNLKKRKATQPSILPDNNNPNGQVNQNGYRERAEPSQTSSESTHKLVRITSVERANFILSQVQESDSFFRFRVIGQKDLDLNAFNKALLNAQAINQPGSKIQWSDVYINGNGLSSTSGIIIIRNLSILERRLHNDLQRKKEVLVTLDSVSVQIKLTDYNNFKSTILNFKQCREYQIRDVAAKRKSPPLTIDGDESSDGESPKLVIDEQHKSSQQSTTIEPDIPSVSSREFIPVTYESVRHVLNLMSRYAEEGCSVVVVFDTCFNYANVTIAEIREKLEPLFGKIDTGCVMIKSNLDQLMPNLDEANSRDYNLRGQAYIITRKGIDMEEFNHRANELNILYGSITMSCVEMNLKKGVYVMHKDALIEAGASPQSVEATHVSDSSSHKAPSAFPQQQAESSRKAKPARSRKKIGVTTNGSANNVASTSNGCGSSGESLLSLEEKLHKKMETDAEKSDVVSRLLPRLSQLGNVVIKVENLPAKLTVHALNLMMGTYSLTGERIIGIKLPDKDGKELMNIRIVIDSDNNDIQKILCKNKCKTVYNDTLVIERTDLKDLEKFLLKHYQKLYELPTALALPINQIGYGKVRPQ